MHPRKQSSRSQSHCCHQRVDIERVAWSVHGLLLSGAVSVQNKMRGIKPNSTAKHQIQQQNGREITCSACCICRGMAAHIRTLWRFEMRVTQALAATLRVHKTTPAIAKLHHRICGWSSHIYRRNWPTQLQQLWCN